MNIDELKKELEAKLFTKDQGMDMEMLSYNDGINDAIRILDTHRADLAPVLRFRKIRGDWAWVDDENKPRICKATSDFLLASVSQPRLRELASELRMTAVFEPEAE